jgi:hypothetical protein
VLNALWLFFLKMGKIWSTTTSRTLAGLRGLPKTKFFFFSEILLKATYIRKKLKLNHLHRFFFEQHAYVNLFLKPFIALGCFFKNQDI